MNFPPVEVEDVKSIFSIAKSTIDVITRLYRQYKEPDNDDPGENEDRKDSIKQAISMLSKETQAKKRSHLEKFVENTLLNPECELKPSTIFSFLNNIEQMTWQQICLLEGFRRKDTNAIEITRYRDSDINAISMEIEAQKLTTLKYLHESGSFVDMHISELGREISKLLDLQSIENSEIGKAFGGGRIRVKTTEIY